MLASPFLSPTWIGEWLREFAHRLPCEIVQISTPCAQKTAVVLLVKRKRYRSFLSFNQLYLNTDGEDAFDRVVVENNSLLCSSGFEQDACRLLAQLAVDSKADEFIASGVTTQTCEHLKAAFSGWHSDVEERTSFQVDLERVRASGDYLSLLSANTRAQIRRALRASQVNGELSLERAHTAKEAHEYLSQLIDLHEPRWREKGDAGAFSSPARRSFHFGFVARAVPVGDAVLLRVRAGESVIGLLYFLVGHGVVNFYQCGFRFVDDARFKPGLLSHYLAVRHFAEAGYREYDFLSSVNAESRYKQSLSTGQRPLYWLTLAQPNVRNTLLHLYRKFR